MNKSWCHKNTFRIIWHFQTSWFPLQKKSDWILNKRFEIWNLQGSFILKAFLQDFINYIGGSFNCDFNGTQGAVAYEQNFFSDHI